MTKKVIKRKRLTPLGVKILAIACFAAGSLGTLGVMKITNRSVQEEPTVVTVVESAYSDEEIEEIKTEAFARGKAEGLTEAKAIMDEKLKQAAQAKEAEEKEESKENIPTPAPTAEPVQDGAEVEGEIEGETEVTEQQEYQEYGSTWSGQVLSQSAGAIQGPSGKETYYNLPMDGVVSNAHRDGITGDYWVRNDGAKMLGSYILAACDVTGSVHNRYDIVETSLGQAICADTGGFAAGNPYQIDIATTWGG